MKSPHFQTKKGKHRITECIFLSASFIFSFRSFSLCLRVFMLLNSTLDLFPVSERALVSLVRANVICCSGSDSILDSCYNPGLKRGLFSDSINTQLEGAPSHWLGARYTSAACPASVGVHLCLKGTRSHCVFPGYEGLSLWKM